MAIATPISLGLSWPLTKQIANFWGVAIRHRHPDVDHRIPMGLVRILTYMKIINIKIN